MTRRARRPYEFLGGPKWVALQYIHCPVNITNNTCADDGKVPIMLSNAKLDICIKWQ